MFVGGGKAEITVDSGAEENVCPREWGAQFGVRDAKRKMKFRNASCTSTAQSLSREPELQHSISFFFEWAACEAYGVARRFL